MIQANRPSGTLATRIPIPKIKHCKALYLTTTKANTKKATPREIAITVIIKTNLSS